MTGELSLTIPSPPPLLKNALAGKIERRYGDSGTYAVKGPWEPWGASEKAREEARAWLKGLGEIEKPLGQEAFNNAMVDLSHAVVVPKMTTEDARGRLRTYHAALADLPASVVLAGLREAIKTCKWFPSVAELRGLMELQAKELRLQIERARTLARKSEPRPKLAAPKIKGFGDLTKAEKDAHARRMAKLMADLTDDGKDYRPRTNYVRMTDAEKKEIFEKWEHEARGKAG